MPDYSISLGEMLAGRSPPGTTFEQQHVRSAAIAVVGEHLKEHHSCYVAGRPRSGKTTIALYVGWEVIQGRHPPRYQARYLDLANFDPHREDSACFPETCYGKEWLLIIDNWHSRPDCHQILERELERHWHRGFSTIFCATRFSADGAGADLPSLSAFRDKPMPIVDAEESVAQVARGMIDARFRVQVGRLSPDARASAHVPNDEDRAQALVAPSNHKKVRGNLRFLRWRLEAWHPELVPLRE
ncbi:hypothetical protein HGA89_01035, partial [bacterium]|nr:hypothetical protein [bacterium]